jgi:hypothetical protein
MPQIIGSLLYAGLSYGSLRIAMTDKLGVEVDVTALPRFLGTRVHLGKTRS